VPINFELPDVNPLGIPEDILLKMPFTVWRIRCGVFGCKRYTHLRDYGFFPIFYHPKGHREKWWNIDRVYFVCSDHWKIIKRGGLVDRKRNHPLIFMNKKIIT
jgi:hypothetical protein